MNRCIKPRLVKLSKIEAARRQIESAIWLWFVDDDMISVQTLATAAHRTMADLADVWGASAWPSTAAYFPKQPPKSTREPSDDAVTYFKDAKDDENYAVSEQWTELCLFDAVMAYSNLAHDRCGSALMSTFVLRFGVQRQELFVPDAFLLLEKRVSKAFNLERLERLSKLEFLKEFLGFLGGPAESAA
ncbi:MAG TPA: hypothetical protein VH207_15305 [Chthoniobacterales bacterium]|jgi:hypothetical protein|nr:hypothetical protein [Chthoniobacterales bacterium]